MRSRRPHIVALAAVCALVAATGCSQDQAQALEFPLPYTNDFSGSCDLPDGSDSAWSNGCADGTYHIVLKDTRLGIAELGLEHPTSTLAVDSDTTYVHGALDGDDITASGVACLDHAEEPSGYLFVVSADGTWAILRKTPSGYDPLVQNGDADQLPATRSAHVRGICMPADSGRSAQLVLQVNGTTIAVVRDRHPFPPFRRFGVVMLGTRPGSEARFDNLRVTRPSAAQLAPIPMPAGSPPLLPLADDFSDASSGWPSTGDASGATGYRQGAYRISVDGAGSASEWADRTIVAEPSVAVEVTAQHAGGPARLGYGVSCYRGATHGYGFQVTPDGGWDIFAQRGDSTDDLASGAMNLAEPSWPLQIQGECVQGSDGAVLLLTVNGVLVGEARDLAGDLGPYDHVGLVVTGRRGDKVSFDDFVARALTPQQERDARDAPPPSEHAIVPAGPAPTAPHTAGTLLTERFSEDRGLWPYQEATGDVSALRGGRYHIVVNLDNSLENPDTKLLHAAPAIAIDADLAERASPLGAGVGCLDGDGNGFLFLIDAEAHHYALWAEQGSEGTEIDAGHSPAVHARGTNHLKATCGSGGERVSLSVNGRKVADVRGGQAPGDYDRVMLWVETARHRGDVTFDNLVVREAS